MMNDNRSPDAFRRHPLEHGLADRSRSGEPGEAMSTAAQAVRLAGAVFGLIIIGIGLSYTLSVIAALRNALIAPAGLAGVIQQWHDVIGPVDVPITVEGEPVAAGRAVAMVVLGAGGAVLAWLCMGIMRVGAHIVSITSGDREAVKRILREVVLKSSAVKQPPPEG